jgi:hypothetical protein
MPTSATADFRDWDGLLASRGAPVLLAELTDLCGSDETAAWDAFDEIEDATAHLEYTRYTFRYIRSARSAETVPFLVAALRGGAVLPDLRAPLVRLLTVIAVGWDEGLVPGGLPAAAPPDPTGPEGAGPATGDDFDGAADGIDIRDMWALPSHAAVGAELPRLLPLLADPDDEVREYTAYLCAWFPARADAVLPALRSRLAEEGSPRVRACLALALAMAAGGRHEPGDVDLVSRLAGDPDPLPRWAAAVALARLLGRAAPDGVVAELRAWAAVDRGTGGTAPPFVSNDVAAAAGAALLETGAAHDAATVEALCRGLLRAGHEEARHRVGALLAAAFPRGPVGAPPPPAELSGPQRRAVAAAALARSAWTDLGHFSDALRAYGLSPAAPPRSGGAGRTPEPDRWSLAAYAGLREWRRVEAASPADAPGVCRLWARPRRPPRAPPLWR